jgi:hypothetical protein
MTTDPKKTARYPATPLAQSTRVALDLPVPATTPEAEKAKFALDPALCGVTVVKSFDGKFGQQDITALLLELDEQIKLLRAGDMSSVEAMLFSQATALQAIFVDLATRAQRQERLPIMQAQLTLALKAQAQCRVTLEALAEVKNPRHPTYVRQQNVAQQQVVTNHPNSFRASSQIENSANGLLKDVSDATLDFSRKAAPSGDHPQVEAMVEDSRTSDGSWKAALK